VGPVSLLGIELMRTKSREHLWLRT
jgi:hypothetical protein